MDEGTLNEANLLCRRGSNSGTIMPHMTILGSSAGGILPCEICLSTSVCSSRTCQDGRYVPPEQSHSSGMQIIIPRLSPYTTCKLAVLAECFLVRVWGVMSCDGDPPVLCSCCSFVMNSEFNCGCFHA